MSFTWYKPKQELGKKIEKELETTDKIIKEMKEKLSFDDQWIVNHARWTKDSCLCELQFANQMDMPLVFPEWEQHYYNLQKLNLRLKKN